jgi:phage shock protein PspC (stress-responsive transcriptional regulator)
MKEILNDLERSIAEKCAAVLKPGKNVVNEEDITRILHEMGPVQADPMADEGDDAGENGPPRIRRLVRQPRGAMIFGVCSGLADYFAVDVIIVRIIFVGLLLFSLIGAPILYVLLRIVMPAGDPSAASPPIPAREHPALLIAAVVVVILGVMSFGSFMPHFSWDYTHDGVPYGVAGWGFIGGIVMLFYLVFLGVIIALGVVLVKYLHSRSRVEQ